MFSENSKISLSLNNKYICVSSKIYDDIYKIKDIIDLVLYDIKNIYRESLSFRVNKTLKLLLNDNDDHLEVIVKNDNIMFSFKYNSNFIQIT